MAKPELGSWHIINATARKRRTYMGAVHGHPRTQVRWVRVTCPPVRAMYIGSRSVFDGTLHETDYGDGDYDRSFAREATHEVWLFVVSDRKAPLYVFPDNVSAPEVRSAPIHAGGLLIGVLEL